MSLGISQFVSWLKLPNGLSLLSSAQSFVSNSPLKVAVNIQAATLTGAENGTVIDFLPGVGTNRNLGYWAVGLEVYHQPIKPYSVEFIGSRIFNFRNTKIQAPLVSTEDLN